MRLFSKPKWRPRRAEDVLFSAGVFCLRLGVFFRAGPTGDRGRRPPAGRLGCLRMPLPSVTAASLVGGGARRKQHKTRCFRSLSFVRRTYHPPRVLGGGRKRNNAQQQGTWGGARNAAHKKPCRSEANKLLNDRPMAPANGQSGAD